MGRKSERTHFGGRARRGRDVPILVYNLPQRGEHFRRVLKVAFDEIFDLLVETESSCFRRRVLHPVGRELVDV